MGAQESATRNREDSIEVGEEYSKKSGAFKLWTHITPCTKNRIVKGTIFTRDLNACSPKDRQVFHNGIKLLKQLHYPHILAFLDSSLSDGILALLTERVEILDLCIDRLDTVEIHAGLRNTLDAILFLHNKVVTLKINAIQIRVGKQVPILAVFIDQSDGPNIQIKRGHVPAANLWHNNICASSVFVSPNGDWKLGSFEFSEPKGVKSSIDATFYKNSRNSLFCPPDEMKCNRERSFRDSFAFGKLIEYCLPYMTNIEESLQSVLLDFSSKICEGSLELDRLCEETSFSNDLVVIISFLQSIQIKTDQEKDDFFKCLMCRLECLPVRVVARRLSRLLLSRYVLIEPRSHSQLLPRLLVPKAAGATSGILPLELFRTSIAPEIVKIFCVRETSVRLAILRHFSLFAPYIPLEKLEGIILDEVLVGSGDVNEDVVAASLKAMGDLVPLLGATRVCGWKFTKKLADGTPKVSSPSRPRVSNICSPDARIRKEESFSQEIYDLSDVSYEDDSLRKVENEGNTRTVSSFWSQNKHIVDVVDSPSQLLRTATEEEENALDEDDWNSNWDENPDETVGNSSRNEVSVASTEQSQPPKRTPMTQNTTKFGSEFEIPGYKARTAEDDLFASMAPEIKTQGTVIDRLIRMKMQQQESAGSASAAENTMENGYFAMNEDLEVGAAWDEEEEEINREDGAKPMDGAKAKVEESR